MKNHYILAVDQGTTSSRAILFNKKGELCSSAQKEIKQIYPKQGWVEHDPLEIWESQVKVCKQVLSMKGMGVSHIHAMGVTNQRETVILWNKKTGQPVYNAIVWQDRRSASFCERLKTGGYANLIKNKTGLEIDPYFSASKINWILEQIPEARELSEHGELAYGTVDSWLIWNFTGGKQHITDVSNASRSMLFNIHSLEWDEELLDLFKIPRNILPEVVSNSVIVGKTEPKLFGESITISGIAGDQQASLFGQLCVGEGKIKNTYGTGCFLMLSTGTTPTESKNKLLTTIAWQLDGIAHYALEGSVFVAGAVVQWLRDELQFIQSSSEIETLAQSVPDNGGVNFVPAFTGLGTPWWNSDVRGMITGLTRGTRKGHLARAALESIAFQNYFVIKAMQEDSGIHISKIRVDGGGASNDLLMQIQADVLGVCIERSTMLENTALGAAYFAGLSTGFWKSIQDIEKLWVPSRIFEPQTNSGYYKNYIENWEAVVNAAIAVGQ